MGPQAGRTDVLVRSGREGSSQPQRKGPVRTQREGVSGTAGLQSCAKRHPEVAAPGDYCKPHSRYPASVRLLM